MEYSALQPILDTALASFAKLLEQDRTAEQFPNVKNILALRMIKVNGWWDEYWAWRRQVWRDNAHTLRTQNPRTRLAAAA